MPGLLDCAVSRQKANNEADDVIRAAERVLAGAAGRDAATPLPVPRTIVEVRGFGFSYGMFRALDDVSFKVHAGEVFALCGPRGCGAQTMLCAIGRTLPGVGEWESEGRVLVAERDVVRDVSPERARNLAATAFFEGLPEEQSVFNALARPVRLRGVHADSALRDAIDAALAIAGARGRLEPLMGEFVCSLSLFDQRLVRLLQAFLRAPHALLAEEPTRGLSCEDACFMQGVLRRIAMCQGIAVVVESCDAHEVEALADRAAFFLEGRLVGIGTPGELASQGADYRARSFFEGRMR